MISNAACEPHVQDLCRFLVSLGAQIDGIESNVLRITGVESLTGGSWSIGPDHIEVGSFIGMAAVTGGDITIDGIVPNDLSDPAGAGTARCGASRSTETGCGCPGPGDRADDLVARFRRSKTPWPAFPPT